MKKPCDALGIPGVRLDTHGFQISREGLCRGRRLNAMAEAKMMHFINLLDQLLSARIF